ncbi:MAG TPA: phasin family protein [Thermoanaerobaculia bacterium]|nr:phasin family protein [Thermoanaerobaculia bacterium]
MDTTNPTDSQQDKTLQDDLKESAHRIWLAGLGALAAAEQEGAKMFNRLVDRGRDFESKGRTEARDTYEKTRTEVKDTYDKARTQAQATWENVGDKVDEVVTAALHRLGVPTREEIHTLTLRVEELNAKVESLKPRVTPAAAGEPAVITPAEATPNPEAKIIV